MRILLLDNFDSFTFNLVHYLESDAHITVDILRNDETELLNLDFEKYSSIVLSPGPGKPEEAGLLLPFIQRIPKDVKVLGVCLGFQALAMHHGAELKQLSTVLHGAKQHLKFDHNKVLYTGIEEPIETGHYHSWIVDIEKLGDQLDICASFVGIPASFQIKDKPWFGVQYHPESILTKHGRKILENWLAYT
jgi:anthranilate synthase component 2